MKLPAGCGGEGSDAKVQLVVDRYGFRVVIYSFSVIAVCNAGIINYDSIICFSRRIIVGICVIYYAGNKERRFGEIFHFI